MPGGGLKLGAESQELVDFLKDRSILKVLDERVLHGISKLFEEIQCGPGHIVFKEGDTADAIYIIRDGSVQILQNDKVITYLTSGDCFGEMGLLHDSTRNATIRVPEEALILKLPRKAFIELQNYFPEVTNEMTKLINRRLAGKLPFSSPGLQGNLAFFDLPTVIQTVVGSRQTGIISLRGRGAKLVAQVFAKSGRLTHASFMHLTGEYALFELLTRNEPLDFVFEQLQDLDANQPIDKALNAKEPHMLLIEGARRADELPKLMMSLQWPDAVFRQKAASADFSKLSAENAAVARKIWLLLEVGLSVQELIAKLPADRFGVLSALDEMVTNGLIATGKPEVKAEEVISGTHHHPPQVAAMVTALNEVSINLATIIGKEKVRELLAKALQESSKRFSNLSSLKMHPENVTLDVRLAAPDVSQSQTSVRSLEDLTYTFLRMVAH
jgi:hypothetical protein